MVEGSAVFNVVALVMLLAGIALVVYLYSVHEKLGRIADALERIAGRGQPPEEPEGSRAQD